MKEKAQDTQTGEAITNHSRESLSSQKKAAIQQYILQAAEDRLTDSYRDKRNRANSAVDHARLFAIAGRYFSDRDPEWTDEEENTAKELGLALHKWSVLDLIRMAQVLQLMQTGPQDTVNILHKIHRTASLEEMHALLLVLPYLNEAPQLNEIAKEGIRSNTEPLFDAIALENPYPLHHLDSPMFNRMVLKAAYLWRSPHLIVGLEKRYNPDLHNSLLDFFRERSSAGREVSSEWIDLANQKGENDHVY